MAAGLNRYYSGVTAGAQIITGRCNLSMVCVTAAAANVTVLIYDATSATGNPIAVNTTIGNSAYPDFAGLPMHTGMFIVVTGAGAQVTVTYE